MDSTPPDLNHLDCRCMEMRQGGASSLLNNNRFDIAVIRILAGCSHALIGQNANDEDRAYAESS